MILTLSAWALLTWALELSSQSFECSSQQSCGCGSHSSSSSHGGGGISISSNSTASSSSSSYVAATAPCG